MQSFHSRRRGRRVVLVPVAIFTLIIIAGLYVRNLAWCFASRQSAITNHIISQLQRQYQQQYHNVSRTLVLGHTKKEDMSWIHNELPHINTALYSVDHPKPPFVVKKNKGNEAMVYLSYIIDNYHNLPDVVLFFHAHRKAWHNNFLHDNDAVRTILELDPAEVIRSGYVNTRCELEPGCPGCAGSSKAGNPTTRLDTLINDVWKELHMVDTVPSVIGQPCCAQFAASRKAILARPLSHYLHYRDWLLRTPLSNRISGQIFEFSWQFIFGGVAEYCLNEMDCWYKNYGILFESPADLNDYRKKWRRKEIWWLRFWQDTASLERELDRRRLDAYRRGNAKKRERSAWLEKDYGFSVGASMLGVDRLHGHSEMRLP
jgi:hypothetical protein